MGETAKPEFCAQCGGRLGIERRIIVGADVTLHPHCVEPWQYRQVGRDALADTSGNGSRP